MWGIQFLETIQNELFISFEQIAKISTAFCREMQAGLGKKPSSLKMLTSFLDKPRGDEQGCFIALDFGGTNVRVLVVELLGQGKFCVKKQLAKPLKAIDGEYDYGSPTATAQQLFDFLAAEIAAAAEGNLQYGLGHTFSFPCSQQSVNSARLLHWTKEIDTRGVEGQDVTVLLQESLGRRGVRNVKPLAVINDTTGTLLTAAYQDPDVDVGSICGTGHNTCYAQPLSGGGFMIMNMESGNFNKLDRTKYDMQLDRDSDRPGEQILEKMTSGRYLGELCRLILSDGIHKGAVAAHLLAGYERPYSLTTEHMARFIESKDARFKLIKVVAAALLRRSARLVAASYGGIFQHLDGGVNRHTVAVDGSLYEKAPGYKEEINNVLQHIFGDGENMRTVAVKDGSGIGAAIAAACILKSKDK